ncbi:MAG: hypothetical protein A2133_11300 [Actinobacteria bacterium RBG_16_64_13]|nr:MAG: hypothetical protein A2133_11300 [Actinobacteria bacterium RBG_16_64_13]
MPAVGPGRASWRHLAYVMTGVLLLCALFWALLVAPAQAFTVQGGTNAQRAHVDQVIKACALWYANTDSELRALGPVKVVFAQMDGVSGYSKPGVIYINSSLQPGEALSELVAHEWSHQIWYSLGPKWWQKWSQVSGAGSFAGAGAWRQDPAENFAECAKIALWSSEYSLRDYAVTDLAVTDPGTLRDWLALARYANKCPFADLGPSVMPTSSSQDELAAAAGYVYAQGIMQGVSDTAFRADAPLTRRQLATICERAGLSCPVAWRYDFGAATRGEVRDTVAGLTWNGESWSEAITRGQMARLVWRSR